MTAETARQKLFTAIGEGKFEQIPSIAAAYRECLVESLSAAEPENRTELVEQALGAFRDSLRYLRAVRAHQLARFQKLSAGALYQRYSDVHC